MSAMRDTRAEATNIVSFKSVKVALCKNVSVADEAEIEVHNEV